MKFRLRANPAHVPIGEDTYVIIDTLSQNLGPAIKHNRQTLRGFYQATKWQLDLEFEQYTYITFWILRVAPRFTKDPWFTEFLLKWT